MLNSCIKFELRKKKKKTPIYSKSFNGICSTIDNVNSSFAAELGVKLLMAITLHDRYGLQNCPCGAFCLFDHQISMHSRKNKTALWLRAS